MSSIRTVYAGTNRRGCVDDDDEADVGLNGGAQRFYWLVESLVDCAVALVDATGRVRSWNRGAQLITGYSPLEAQTRPLGARSRRHSGRDCRTARWSSLVGGPARIILSTGLMPS